MNQNSGIMAGYQFYISLQFKTIRWNLHSQKTLNCLYVNSTCNYYLRQLTLFIYINWCVVVSVLCCTKGFRTLCEDFRNGEGKWPDDGAVYKALGFIKGNEHQYSSVLDNQYLFEITYG